MPILLLSTDKHWEQQPLPSLPIPLEVQLHLPHLGEGTEEEDYQEEGTQERVRVILDRNGSKKITRVLELEMMIGLHREPGQLLVDQEEVEVQLLLLLGLRIGKGREGEEEEEGLELIFISEDCRNLVGIGFKEAEEEEIQLRVQEVIEMIGPGTDRDTTVREIGTGTVGKRVHMRGLEMEGEVVVRHRRGGTVRVIGELLHY